MKTQFKVTLCLLLQMGFQPGARFLNAQTVKDSSFTAVTGERILQQEIIVDATLEQVWQTLTTSEGLRTFVAPTITVDLRTGGDWFANYKVGSKVGDPGTIHNTVLNYLPMKMFSIRIGLTDVFPKELRDADTLFEVLTLKNLGNKKVKVVDSIVGWKSGPDWDKTYEFFRRGDEATLKVLYRRFKDGPIDWNKKNPYADGHE
jgi:uncharacterized protein YndB with AHSA1/START domain